MLPIKVWGLIAKFKAKAKLTDNIPSQGVQVWLRLVGRTWVVK